MKETSTGHILSAFTSNFQSSKMLDDVCLKTASLGALSIFYPFIHHDINPWFLSSFPFKMTKTKYVNIYCNIMCSLFFWLELCNAKAKKGQWFLSKQNILVHINICTSVFYIRKTYSWVILNIPSPEVKNPSYPDQNDPRRKTSKVQTANKLRYREHRFLNYFILV